MVGSTAISAQLDPEEWRETIADYHRLAAAAITRFDGHVAKYLGDGVMAYFGWPAAHDNDAERALRAGLAILDAISARNQQPGHVRLSARVGVDSGLVVIGQGASHDADVFGDTANLAAHVQAAARPGTVAMTDATQRLVSGLFVVENTGRHTLKGSDRPLQLYRVVRPSGARGRFQAATAAGGLTSFVGRGDELQVLMGRWQRVLEGVGQVAVIVGEAGIGKSRLVQRFREQIAHTPQTWVEAGAGPFFQSTPFYAVSEILQHLAWNQSFDRLGDYLSGLENEAPKDGVEPAPRDARPVADQIEQLQSELKLAGLLPDEAIPLIAPLLNLPLPPSYPPSALAPDQQRRRLLGTLVEWILGAARAQPLVIAIEDLHWADPSTLELICLLVDQGAGARLMLLFTARPEFHPPWTMRAHHAQITLDRLSVDHVRTMVGRLAAHGSLPDETIATVVERTGGVPLFVEELTRAIVESGDTRPGMREIPATLHDSLMARLDRLGPAKNVAQIAAVIGREFSYDLLRAVAPIPEADLKNALLTLTGAELIQVRGIAPDATYQFKHALIQDAAYEALLKSRRKELHLVVARTIDEQFPTIKETHPQLLAQHWSEAGEIESAIAEWTRAGEAAQARNSFKEAQEAYHQALALVVQLPETSERDGRELELRQSVVWMLYLTSGWASPESIDATERAAALAEQTGNLTLLGSWVRSKSLTAFMAGDLRNALLLSDRALDLARREESPTSLAPAHIMQQVTRFWLGDFSGAEQHLAAGQPFFEDSAFRQTFGAGILPALGIASWNAWALGRSDLARQRIAQMKAAANDNHPLEAAMSGHHAAYLHVLMREYKQAAETAAQVVDHCEKHQIPYFAATVGCMLGQARSQLGSGIEGIDLIRQGLKVLLEIGGIGLTYFTAYLAEAQTRAGAIIEALETVEQALQANPDELACKPEILRLRGELRLRQRNTEQAESDFREAIALAQSMSARSWELRTSMSLARLLRVTGRRAEARTMLADIYNWFTEGFDTADLIEARALREELSA